MKKTLILGATTNSGRVAYKAAADLVANGHEIVPVGIKKGEVQGKEILHTKEIQKDIDTITLYIGPHRQQEWYDYLLDTAPKRIIFNPGTENTALAELAKKRGIEVDFACTLVLLSLGNY